MSESLDAVLKNIAATELDSLTALGMKPNGLSCIFSTRKSIADVRADSESLAQLLDECRHKRVEFDGYLHPFLNEVVLRNLGYGSKMNEALERVKDWSIAIDGGAQVGRVANRLAEKFEKVYAIELTPENFACLVKNARPNVVPVHGCLGDGRTAGYEPDKDPESPVFRALEGGEIRGVTIDELGLPSCGFIKLDLQGFDYFALKGAEQTLRRFKPVLYFEYDPSCFERYGVHGNAHQIFLESLGYEFLGKEDGNHLYATA